MNTMTKAHHEQMVAAYRQRRDQYVDDMQRADAPYTRMDNIQSIDRYVEHQIPTGGFLKSVITNDLRMAFGMADEDNKMHMEGIVSFIVACLPLTCKDFQVWLATEITKE